MIKILTSGRNGSATHALATRIIPEAKVIANAANYLQALIGSLETTVKDYETYSGSRTADPATQELVHLDEVQDNDFMWMRDFTSVQRHSPDANVAKAAVTLWPVLERHGLSLYAESYADESSDLRSLLAELNGAALQGAVGTVGLRPWIDRLSAAATAFNNCYMQRAASGKPTDALKTKTAVDGLTKYLNMLLSNLDLLEETSKDAAIQARLKTINTVVEQHNAQMRAARTRSASGKDAGDEVAKK